LKEQQHTQIAQSINVFRIKRNDGTKFRDGEVRLLLLEIFLSLSLMGFDLLLMSGSGIRIGTRLLGETWEQPEKENHPQQNDPVCPHVTIVWRGIVSETSSLSSEPQE
jgi:hypothetical protein